MLTVTPTARRPLALALGLSGFRWGRSGARRTNGTDSIAFRNAFQTRHCFTHCVVGKDHGELFAAVAKGLCPAAEGAETRRDHPEQLITNAVAVLIIEPLEVVNVDHRDGVAWPEAVQILLERAASGQASQSVAVREAVRGLKQ